VSPDELILAANGDGRFEAGRRLQGKLDKSDLVQDTLMNRWPPRRESDRD